MLEVLQFMHKVGLIVDKLVNQNLECLLSLVNRLLMLFKLKFLLLSHLHFLCHLLKLPIPQTFNTN
jgi:hypothetical protein